MCLSQNLGNVLIVYLYSWRRCSLRKCSLRTLCILYTRQREQPAGYQEPFPKGWETYSDGPEVDDKLLKSICQDLWMRVSTAPVSGGQEYSGRREEKQERSNSIGRPMNHLNLCSSFYCHPLCLAWLLDFFWAYLDGPGTTSTEGFAVNFLGCFFLFPPSRRIINNHA